MLTASIHNTSALYSLTPASEPSTYPPPFPAIPQLPPPFQYLTIAPSTTVNAVCTVDDLEQVVNNNSGKRSSDILQEMVQRGQITISFATVSGAVDVFGNAVHAQ